MGYKLALLANPEALNAGLKCAACSCVLESPVGLPCCPDRLVCLACLRNPRTGRQRLFRCPGCDDRLSGDFVAGASSAGDAARVPNWVRAQLNGLRLSCPRRCGAAGLKIAELEHHYGAVCAKSEAACPNAGCGRSYKREAEAAHSLECSYKRVECRVCKKSMLRKDLLAHQFKTRCHELEMKLGRKQCMKQCNKEVLDHYRLLREHSLVSMQEFRRTELSHLQRMGVQGFVRREPLPLLSCLSMGETVRRCDRCSRMYNNETNHEMACRWHGGPIIQTFGGLCLACGKPSHTEGCIISAHTSAASASLSSSSSPAAAAAARVPPGGSNLRLSTTVHVNY